VPLSSTKGSHGHLLGAAGAVESILTILATFHKVLPPSLNVENLEEGFRELNIVKNSNITIDSEMNIFTLKNSFGFGGTNASLCFSSYSDS